MSFDIEGGQILLSLLDETYKPLPSIGDFIKKGDVYAKLKHIGQDGIESINIDPKNLHVPIDCEIINIEIYPNSWNKQISQFDNFIKTLINNQNSSIEEIKTQLKSYMTIEEIENILSFYEISKLRVTDDPAPKKSSKYSEKGKNIDGVKIKITGIHKSKIAIGDKVANRHGSKGVIAKIIPENEMPMLEDGRRLEIILNPLGIISRMNIGQLFELHVTETLHNLKEIIKKYYLKHNKLSDKIVKQIEDYFDILDVTQEKWTSKHIINKFNKMFKTNPIQAIEDLQVIQPPFESIHPKDLEKVMNLTNSKYKQPLYDNNSKKCFKNDIAVGYMYFNKLIHRSEEKLISRSVGPYVNTTLQPVAGKRKHGGHRLGEMEIWAFLAQGADITLEEFLTTHSDSPGKKLKVLSDILENTEMLIQNDAPDVPRTLSLMIAMLKTTGLELEYD
jgi:DNA-directed RNA polymerase subunit beta